VRGADLAHWRDEAERVFGIINHAMEHLPDFRPWPRESLYSLMESLLPVADGDLVLFAETEDGQVVGWLPGHPEAERGADPRRRAALPLELSSHNPRTPQLAGHLGAVIYKRYRVYRRWLAGVPLDVPVPLAAPAAKP
jgi:hypothetical protein